MKNIKKSFEKQSFFINCLVDISPKYKYDDYQSIYYRKPNNDDIWFELWIDQESKIKYLGSSYDKIWSVLYKEFRMKYSDNQEFIRNIVYKHTNWGLVTPCFCDFKGR